MYLLRQVLIDAFEISHLLSRLREQIDNVFDVTRRRRIRDDALQRASGHTIVNGSPARVAIGKEFEIAFLPPKTPQNEDKVEHVDVNSRNIDSIEAKYKLSHCLTLPAGEKAVWLLLAELVEYYKVLGVEYFYIYVEDIDDYSQKVLKSYVESDDAEVIRFPTDNDVDFQFVAMQECLYRSRQHSRWVEFGDINDRFAMHGRAILLDVVYDTTASNDSISSLRFQSNYEFQTWSPPSEYKGWRGIVESLPLLNSCNAKKLAPAYGFTHVVHPNRTIAVGQSEIQLFPNYVRAIVDPAAIAHSRHYVRSIPQGSFYGALNQNKSQEDGLSAPFQCPMRGILFLNIKIRLDNVYGNGSYTQVPTIALSLALYGNGTKWLLLTEFVEHYKLVGVEYFYVYVKDIDEYSKRVLDDYVRTGKIETIFLRTPLDRVTSTNPQLFTTVSIAVDITLDTSFSLLRGWIQYMCFSDEKTVRRINAIVCALHAHYGFDIVITVIIIFRIARGDKMLLNYLSRW
ncbi:unnamed protein product [Nippostrongylus brasiliensis]|uniref:Glycosyltransferase family 92 protein n=1 Tax=Nippostrongylus brasiliensis TaxID=27835 RepID=A0A0N4YIN1_NIPBR|nr:unnamed protein product [Nippostrongylus brasiliensis]